MDISETYIKMCEKAEEIQKDWTPQLADLYVLDKTAAKVERESLGDPTDCHRIHLMLSDNLISRHKKWLPRQDQLQEMVKWAEVSAGQLLDRFHVWFLQWAHTGSHQPFELSMEQLWLAFVMHEKYGKTWNRNEWEKQ